MPILTAVRHAALLLALACPAAADTGEPFTGDWRFTVAQVAPWADPAAVPIPSGWIGHTLRIGAPRPAGGEVDGPPPLRCRSAVHQPTRMPPEGLFQGNLPAPAARAAFSLALVDDLADETAGGEVDGFSLTCHAGVFEFHRADADTLLVAIDNVIWTLDRTPGTRASAGTPEAAVQRFLEAHFAADMAFTPEGAQARRAGFTDALWQAIAAYFARPAPVDEPPPINGDPFTDSQEYPLRFAVQAARPLARDVPAATADPDASTDPATPDAAQAVVVDLTFVGLRRPVTWVMRHEHGDWRLDDLRYSDAGQPPATLRGSLE